MSGNQQAIREACERAKAGAGGVLHAARTERDQIAATEGAEALAAWIAPGLDAAGKAEAVAYWESLTKQQAGGESAA